MNNYKFGNYICKLREEKNLTQAELAKELNVSDKAVSKWENGQAFPRTETFEKLAVALNTTVEDIFSASRDGVKRICVANNFSSVMNIDINGHLFAIGLNESKWIEITSDTAIIKITGNIITEDDFNELDATMNESLKEKIMSKLLKKSVNYFLDLTLQVDCKYKVSNITADSLITVELDSFNLGDKTWMYEDFQVIYPKISCNNMNVELLSASGKNSKSITKKYQRLGLASDLGLGFIEMFLLYPIRGIYFRHLCKPHVIKKNILNLEKLNNNPKKGKHKKLGCLSFALILVLLLIIDFFVLDIVFVNREKPYLVANDYSTITYRSDVYVRIKELPDYAREVTMLGAEVWKDARTDGLSKIDQSIQDSKVKLYDDNNGNQYLWLVEDYFDTIIADEGNDKDYEDFQEHYVYVCNSPQQ